MLPSDKITEMTLGQLQATIPEFRSNLSTQRKKHIEDLLWPIWMALSKSWMIRFADNVTHRFSEYS